MSGLRPANSYLADRPGTVGFVLRDRVTGTRYRNPNSGHLVWTASTIKLGMVADLLTRERLGAVRLSADDRAMMVAMLRDSDNTAADTLWSRYGGTGHRGLQCQLSPIRTVRPAPGAGIQHDIPVLGHPEIQHRRPGPLDELCSDRA